MISVAWRHTYFCPPGSLKNPWPFRATATAAETGLLGIFFFVHQNTRAWLQEGGALITWRESSTTREKVKKMGNSETFSQKKNIFAIHLAFSRSSHIYIWHFVPNKKTTPKQQKTRSFRRLYKSPIPLYHLKLDISNARAWPRLHFLGLPGPLELLQASFFAEKNRPKHHGWQARYNFCICKQLYKRLWNLRDFIMISFVICIYHVSYIFPYISFVSCFSWVACMPPDESHQIACGWILHDFRFADFLRQNWNHFGSYKPTLNSRQEKQGFHEGLCQGCDNDHILNICCLVLVYLPINIEGVNQQLVVHIGPLWGNFAGWQL